MLPILSYVQHYKKYHAARFEAASVQYGLNQLEIDILLFQRLLGFAPDALPMVAVLADIQRCSLEPLFAGFTAQEQQTLQDYLRRMDANLQRELNKE